jgi:hypothetical protein
MGPTRSAADDDYLSGRAGNDLLEGGRLSGDYLDGIGNDSLYGGEVTSAGYGAGIIADGGAGNATASMSTIYGGNTTSFRATAMIISSLCQR